MENGKSPGIDGIPVEFYKEFFDLFKKNFYKIFLITFYSIQKQHQMLGIKQ